MRGEKGFFFILILVLLSSSYCGDDNGGSVCGNNKCEIDENGDNCPQDCQTVCGNGKKEGSEECDGMDLGGATCESLGFAGGILGCSSECKYLTLNCQTLCGNGVIDEGEECDRTNLNNKSCVDLGFQRGVLRCGADCKFDTTRCSNQSGIGGRCSQDSDCYYGVCLNEEGFGFPGGYCIDQCGQDGSCPDPASVCVAVGMYYLCVKQCNPQNPDCRAGYECVDIGEGMGACWPNCTEDSQCEETGNCDTEEGSESQGFCICGEGTHLDEERGECVNDTCEYLRCEERGMSCNPSYSRNEEGDIASCDACLDPSYTMAEDYCYPQGANYGGECRSRKDCPGEHFDNVRCIKTTGGYCVTINECNSEGQPCNNLQGSVCVFNQDYNLYNCVASCNADSDCRPGYFCRDFRGVKGCWPIADCDTRGCNDTNSNVEYYCDANGEQGYRYCWKDGCSGDPCMGKENATGDCFRIKDSYICECNDGYLWISDISSCQACSSYYRDLGLISSPHRERNQNSCVDGTTIYSPGPRSSCIEYPEEGAEIVYRIVLPPNTTVVVSMTPQTNNVDVALYVITTCGDIMAENSCVVGADEGIGGEEERVTLNNSTNSEQEYYIVADTYSEDSSTCGIFDLEIIPQ